MVVLIATVGVGVGKFVVMVFGVLACGGLVVSRRGRVRGRFGSIDRFSSCGCVVLVR